MPDYKSDQLLDWYDEHKRILPWREDPTPYHVWVSEIMLQQTRVSAVIEYYNRFMKALPDIKALAAAPEDQYMKLWEGLGYYSRIRNMHKAAEAIMQEYDGEMPSTSTELRKLSGIGSYTASAIASIAFGEAIPAIDGNLLRIYARMTGCRDNILDPQIKKAAQSWFGEFISEERPGDFNQALMDLGSMVCLPGTAPDCENCPWIASCASFNQQLTGELPVRITKVKRKIQKMTILLIRDENGFYIRKRPASGLLAGLYEFPSFEGHLTISEAVKIIESYGFTVRDYYKLDDAKHIFTHITWQMIGYEINVTAPSDATLASTTTDTPGTQLINATAQEIDQQYSIPGAFKAYKKYLHVT